MAEIITINDLPAALQSADLVALMIAGANAKASRVAPCIVPPTTTAWAASTVYALGTPVKLTAVNEFLVVTAAGTSGTLSRRANRRRFSATLNLP